MDRLLEIENELAQLIREIAADLYRHSTHTCGNHRCGHPPDTECKVRNGEHIDIQLTCHSATSGSGHITISVSLAEAPQ
jgi:hypothetical protein